MANDFALIENPRLSGARMLQQGINNGANLYGQIQQLQLQKEELQAKKNGQKFDAATSLFKSAPDSIKVQIFNKTIRPLSKEMFGYDAPELTQEDIQSPIIQNMLKEQAQIDKMDVDPAVKKRMYQTTGVKALGALGEYKAAVDASIKDLTEPNGSEPPIPIMKKGDGFINPLSGEKIVYDPTKKYQVITDPSQNPNLERRDTGQELQLDAAFRKESEPYKSALLGYNEGITSSREKTGVGDNTLVRAIVKVAEGKGARVSDADVAAFANTGSIPQNIKGYFLKAATGRRLPDEVRAQFESLLNNYYKTAQARQIQLESEFTDKARLYGFDPNKIVMKFRPKSEYDTGMNKDGGSENKTTGSNIVTAVNKKTGERIMSKDGGKTWLPVQ